MFIKGWITDSPLARLEREKRKRRRRLINQGKRARASDRAKVRRIASIIAQMHKITIPVLLGPTKPQPVARVRHIAIWVAKKVHPKISFPQIGWVFGRDNASVRRSYEVVEKRPDLFAEAIVILEHVQNALI